MNLDELATEWGIPRQVSASGGFEITLTYETYDIVHSISLIGGRVSMLSYLRIANSTTQVVRRKFATLGEQESTG